ncbi:MAG: ribonuclease H-like domain-containing protein [Desulfobaccales bacterium]
MIKRTFIHLPGVGLKTEAHLWRRGFATWEDLLAADCLPGVGAARLALFQSLLRESLACLDQPGYFAARLPAGEQWRLFRHFRSCTAYLDIETSGAAWPNLPVTVVGLYDGRDFRQFILGQNLRDFPAAFEGVEILVTFNGSQFDLPVLQAAFPGLRLPPVHLDLRFILARLGFRGGLKNIEPRFGIHRPPEVTGMNGYDAVLLWERSQRGDLGARELLLHYNREDVLNLAILMERAFELGRERLLSNVAPGP